MAAQWMKERFDVNWKEKKKVWCVLKSKLSNFVKKKNCQSIIVHWLNVGYQKHRKNFRAANFKTAKFWTCQKLIEY